jgi:hypothetical protein
MRLRDGNDSSGQREHAWVGDTRLVQAWTAMKQEILRHKWIESERAGSDIGWDRAFVEWTRCHQRAFLRHFESLRHGLHPRKP